jgi:hypothetical protein
VTHFRTGYAFLFDEIWPESHNHSGPAVLARELKRSRRPANVVSTQSPTPTVAGFIGRASGYVAEALRYWEPRRLFYNGILLAVVATHIITKWSNVQKILTFDLFLLLFLFAVAANICYCAVYAVDLFVRFSGLQAAWEKGRIVVLLVGTAFAAVITHFLSSGILSPQ